MDRATFDGEALRHRRIYESSREEIKRKHAGKYVALGQGCVLASAPTYDEAQRIVEGLQPVPEYYLIFPAEMEPSFELAYDL